MAKIKTQSQNSHKHRPVGVSAKDFDKAHWPYLPLLIVMGTGTVAMGALELGASGAIAGGAVMLLASFALAL